MAAYSYKVVSALKEWIRTAGLKFWQLHTTLFGLHRCSFPCMRADWASSGMLAAFFRTPSCCAMHPCSQCPMHEYLGAEP